MERLQGIVPPVITPLNQYGNLDCDALKKHHEYLLKHGVSGLFVLGTTGEGPALPKRIKEEMIARTVENCNGRVPILAGISADGLEDYLTVADFAARHGASGVVAAPPSYFPYEPRELLEFFRILTLEQPLPVYIYNMPAMTKINMQPDLLLQIAALPGVAGYKDSAGDLNNFISVANELKKREDFSLFMGPDTLLGDALANGACGGVNSGANLAPQLYVGRYQAHLAEDTAKMQMYQSWIEKLQQVYQFRENICCGVAAGLKYALSKLDIVEKHLCRPAVPIDSEPVIDRFVKEFQQEFSAE